MIYAIIIIVTAVAIFLIFRNDHDDSYNKSEKGPRKEPKAQGLVACFWANYSYNSNGDKTRFERAYFSADQVYNDYFGKYFYDSYGNWIQRNETTEPAFQHGQHFTDTIKREIEYY